MATLFEHTVVCFFSEETICLLAVISNEFRLVVIVTLSSELLVNEAIVCCIWESSEAFIAV